MRSGVRSPLVPPTESDENQQVARAARFLVLELLTSHIRFESNQATSVLAGTVNPDHDGGAGRLGILGPVTLAPTLRIEIDIPVTDDIPNDRVEFSSVGPVLDGTLDLNLFTLPDLGAEFRVVSTSGATGAFAEIQGAQAIEDGDGVLLIR